MNGSETESADESSHDGIPLINSPSAKTPDHTGHHQSLTADNVKATPHSQQPVATGHVTRSPEGALRPTPIKMGVSIYVWTLDTFQ